MAPDSFTPQTFALRGVFASDAALQDAVGRLTLCGFDRANLSVPNLSVPEFSKGLAQSAEPPAPATEDDSRQTRTLQSGLAAAAGVMVGAGLTAATGGAAAVAVVAALGLGAAAGGAVSAVHAAGDAAAHGERDDAAAAGGLVLSAVADTQERAVRGEAAMREAGAAEVTSTPR